MEPTKRPAATTDTPQGAPEPLASVVERQRRENENLHAALRTRAVIEQAKGILVARTGIDPETAFRRLTEHSQRTNRKLTRVAAEVVAATVTAQPSAGDRTTDEAELLVAGSPRPEAFLTAAAVIAAPDLTELLGAVIQYARPYGVMAGMLALAEPDGALRIVGHHGMETHAISGWQRIPPGTGLPVSATAQDRRSVWLHDRRDREARFPDARRFPGHIEACAVLPLQLDRQLVGVLALDWETPQDFPPSTRQALESVAELCAGPIAQLLRDYDDPLPGLDFEPGYAPWFWAFLDSQPVAELILEPHIDGDDISDLVVVHANTDAAKATRLSHGARLLEHFPRLIDSEAIEKAARVLRTGRPHREPQVAVPAAAGDGKTFFEDVSIHRVGTLLVVAWTRVRRDGAAEPRVGATEQ